MWREAHAAAGGNLPGISQHDDHATAEALYRQVKKQRPMMSQNTVY
jgi:Fe2+ or Zn2+ uptake regulation protein